MPPKRKVAQVYDSTAYPSGSSTSGNNYSQLPTAPAPKRPRKTKAGSGVAEEKRLARFKPNCPKVTLDRVGRVLQQRFFMVDRSREGSELKESFKVLGSTGNVYDVVIDRIPSCSCPDAMNGNHCKHILFVFLKVLNVPVTSTHYYQKALLSSELAAIFAAAPVNPTHVVSQRVRDAYSRATGIVPKGSPAAAAAPPEDKRRIPDGDDCPICYEEMTPKSVPQLDFCDECGNALHKECFAQWTRTARAKGDDVTCVWCRTKWTFPSGSSSGNVGSGSSSAEGYLNLADAAGLSSHRDSSTYYDGLRAGAPHWGRRNYYDRYS